MFYYTVWVLRLLNGRLSCRIPWSLVTKAIKLSSHISGLLTMQLLLYESDDHEFNEV